MERRQSLTLLVHGGSATVALVVGIPTLIYAVSPGKTTDGSEQWVTLGPAVAFEVGKVQAAVVSQSSDELPVNSLPAGVYVWRLGKSEFIVFSRSCTDLGCPITFDQGSACFFCPCHGGIFSQEGEPMAGPPDRPLYRYQTRVHDGELLIDLKSVPIVA